MKIKAIKGESSGAKYLRVQDAIPSGPVAECSLIRRRRSATSSGVMSKKERSLGETARASMEKLGRQDTVLKHGAKKSLRSVALSTSDKADLVPFTKTLDNDRDVRGRTCLIPAQNFFGLEVDSTSC